MNQGRIIVITGSPGTGKTTTASIVAKESDMLFSLLKQRRNTTTFARIQRAKSGCH